MADEVVLHGGEGTALEMAGGHTEIKATSEQTGGRYSLVEHTVARRFPGSRHMSMRSTRRRSTCWRGARVPGRRPHRGGGARHVCPRPTGSSTPFSNPGAGSARVTEIDSPGGFEGYFRDLAEAFPSDTPVDRTVVAEIQSRYDTHPPTA